MNEERRDERFAALALAAAVVMLPPFLGIFNTGAMVLGVPLLFLYLFAVWGVVIALAAVLTRRQRLSLPASKAHPAGLGRPAPDQEETAPDSGSRAATKTGSGG
jgi:hypothetical protein